MASVTIRIPPSAHDRARRLAKAEETTLGEVIDIALERYEREQMLAAFAADMERIWADRDAKQEYESDVALWETTVADGLGDFPYEGVEQLVREDDKE